MKKTLFAVIIAAIVAAAMPGVTGAQDAVDPDRQTVRLTDPNRPGTVQVRLFQGSMTVRAYDGKDVIITARGSTRRSYAFGRNPRTEGLRRLSSGGLSLNEENNVVSIRDDSFDNLSLDIQVPVKTNLKLDATITGNLLVERVDGDIEVTSLNGGVTLTNVAGSVVAHSTNGGLLVTMQRITPQKPMAFTSVNGNVDVALPPDTMANLRLRTTRGDLYTDFDVQLKPSTTATAVGSRRSFGRFGLDLERSILGTINGGGPDFEFRTVNGDVYIRKGK